MKVTALPGDQSLERRARRGRESRCKLAVLFNAVIGGCSKHRRRVVGQRIVTGGMSGFEPERLAAAFDPKQTFAWIRATLD